MRKKRIQVRVLHMKEIDYFMGKHEMGRVAHVPGNQANTICVPKHPLQEYV